VTSFTELRRDGMEVSVIANASPRRRPGPIFNGRATLPQSGVPVVAASDYVTPSPTSSGPDRAPIPRSAPTARSRDTRAKLRRFFEWIAIRSRCGARRVGDARLGKALERYASIRISRRPDR